MTVCIQWYFSVKGDIYICIQRGPKIGFSLSFCIFIITDYDYNLGFCSLMEKETALAPS